MTPRYYQTRCHNSVLMAWGDIPGATETFKKVLCSLPTAAGKTLVAAMLFKSITEAGGRVMFLGDSDELCQQPLEKIYNATGIACALEKADSRASLRANAVVGSAQTLARQNRLERFPRSHFSHIIADEVHRGSDRHAKIFEYFSCAKVLGVTATAFRSNMKDLSAYYDYVAYKLETFDLVDAGFLPPIKVCSLPIDIDLSNVKQSKVFGENDYNAEETSSAIKPYYEKIAEAIKEQFRYRQIVAFLPLIQSSKDFVDVCTHAGIKAEHIDGTSDNRKYLLRAFEQKKFQVLANSSLLSTGWDCSSADTLLNLKPTRSVGLFRQMAGRIVRVLPSVIDHIPGEHQSAERRAAIAASEKPFALIIDLLYQTPKFGLAGASSLIAANEDDMREIEKRARKNRYPQALQEIAKAYQEEKEAKVIAELAALAHRKSLIVDAQELSAMLHIPDLGDYEPVFAWEEEPISEKQKSVLVRNGIDPESVKGRGHASKILDEIFKRMDSGKANVPTIRKLISKGVANASTLPQVAAMEILGISGPTMGFGKHRDTPLEQVPAGYWSWIRDQKWFSARKFPVQHAFMLTRNRKSS